MKFSELDLDNSILEGIDAMNFQEMTPVQEQTIPVLLEQRDLIACAQTGTGKTAAYTLPLLNCLAHGKYAPNKVKSIIMAPTRELAQQIDMQIEGFSYFMPISTVAIYGGGDGAGWDQQKRGLKSGVDIIIATPGRLISHIKNSDIDLSHVKHFILDEADRMLDMGFLDDIMQIIHETPEDRQTVMFSATLPTKIRKMAKQILHNPVEVNIAISKPNEAIMQSAYVCFDSQKMAIIKDLFKKPLDKKTILFSSSKQKVKDVTYTLRRMKIKATAMHSDLDQSEREQVMLDFKNGRIDILVATDIVARGIDIEDIGLIINYDVPRDPEDYIHRIGRTARASAEGMAITLVSEFDQEKLLRIEELIEKEIYKTPLPAEAGPGPEYAPKKNGSGGDRRPAAGNHRRGGNDRGGNRRFPKKRNPNRPSE